MAGANGGSIGKGVNTAIDALRGSPLILALVLLQLVVVAAILYNSVHRQEAVTAQIAALVDLLKLCLGHSAGG